MDRKNEERENEERMKRENEERMKRDVKR